MVGLSARDVLDVPGVHQHHLEVGFEHVVDRLPVDARRLHGHVGDIEAPQPLREGQQIGSRRSEARHFLRPHTPGIGEPGTDHQLGLPDVDPGATLDQLVELFDRGLLPCHGHLPCRSRCRLQGGPPWSTSLTVALDGSSTRCRSDLRAKLIYGLRAPRRSRRLSRRPYQHFIVRGGRPWAAHGQLI